MGAFVPEGGGGAGGVVEGKLGVWKGWKTRETLTVEAADLGLDSTWKKSHRDFVGKEHRKKRRAGKVAVAGILKMAMAAGVPWIHMNFEANMTAAPHLRAIAMRMAMVSL